MLDTIREAWFWLGMNPAEIEACNEFGNVIFRADDGTYWRICPEELACDQIAQDAQAYAALWDDDDFVLDWCMERLVAEARELIGPLDEDRCYCLKIPAVLGGAYKSHNLGSISRTELISFSGDVANQIKDVPDGQEVVFKFVD